ncbi:Brefeldin A resistance protein [Sphaceloma murrayae]|uniref:Brefeldin A resistance protein n=1 Tax=Sphaceloma murrayae TaxID=2082308 RepID=A0A2K1QGS5_9PEZI|nr:Brefeldin A resistance protein [Sphaceloma murrayae]
MAIPPPAVIILAMVGGGFLVLVAAAIHRTMSNRVQRNPMQRYPEQDNYMRQVRQQNLDNMMPAYMKPGMTHSVPYSMPYTEESGSRV